MGMFSAAFDTFVQQRFRKDEAGRLVFLPYGVRRPGYYIEARDEYSIKSLVKIYAVAGALINLTGYVASFTVAQALTFHNHSGPLERRVETAIGIYIISATILFIGPALILWSVYKGVMAGLCSSLATVGPESIRQMKQPPSLRRTLMILVWAGIIFLGLGVLFAVRYRP
jgi:hypothetical protein